MTSKEKALIGLVSCAGVIFAGSLAGVTNYFGEAARKERDVALQRVRVCDHVRIESEQCNEFLVTLPRTCQLSPN